MGTIVKDMDSDMDKYFAYRWNTRFSQDLRSGEAYLTATYDGKGGTEPNHEDPWGFLLNTTLKQDMDRLWDAWDPGTRANLVGKEVGLKGRKGERVVYSMRSIHSGRD